MYLFNSAWNLLRVIAICIGICLLGLYAYKCYGHVIDFEINCEVAVENSGMLDRSNNDQLSGPMDRACYPDHPDRESRDRDIEKGTLSWN